jgi:hypothetical protein
LPAQAGFVVHAGATSPRAGRIGGKSAAERG